MENVKEEPPTPPPPPPIPPFWLQPTTRSRYQLRRWLPSSALFLSTGFLIGILCISAIVFLALVIPYLVSLTHQVLKPTLIRRSWDFLNLVLILFAMVCGFLGRKDKDDQRDQDVDNSIDVSTYQSELILDQRCNNLYDYEYGQNHNYGFGDLVSVTKLRRSSSSYPDLRQGVSWDVEYDHRPRYYDDSYAINYINHPRSLRSIGSFGYQEGIDGNSDGEDNLDIKRIEMDDSVTTSIKKGTPTTPLYYSKVRKSSPRKDCETIGRRGRKAPKAPPPSGPSPPILKKIRTPLPSPPPTPLPLLERKNGKRMTKEIFTSIYQQSKRKSTKLHKRKSHENLKDLRPPSPPPPTPLAPPPPPSKLHNIISPKKAKLGKKTTNLDPAYETKGDGSTIPIPISLGSLHMQLDGLDGAGNSPMAGNSSPVAFCLSPDVNTKADDFIARFKARLKLEKVNSIRMKQGMGIPDSSRSPTPSPHAMPPSPSF